MVAVAQHREAVADCQHPDPAVAAIRNAEQRRKAAAIEGGLLHPRQVVAVVQLGIVGNRLGDPGLVKIGMLRVAARQDARP
jgi:hypothetical protein